jgi:hypothetical protein
MQTIGKWIIVGFGMLLVMVLGYFLTRSGKPYPVLLLTVHKLIPVAVVVFLITTLIRTNQETSLSVYLWITAVLTIVFYVSMFVTGALVSLKKEMPAFVYSLHHILSYCSLAATATTAYLLLRGG